MKKQLLILSILMILFVYKSYGQCGGSKANINKPTSVGIVIYSNDEETVWNVFRFANYAVSTNDTVNIFLLGKGVELESLDSKKYNLKEQTEIYKKKGGKILACGTCLQSRNISEPKVCSIFLQ